MVVAWVDLEADGHDHGQTVLSDVGPQWIERAYERQRQNGLGRLGQLGEVALVEPGHEVVSLVLDGHRRNPDFHGAGVGIVDEHGEPPVDAHFETVGLGEFRDVGDCLKQRPRIHGHLGFGRDQLGDDLFERRELRVHQLAFERQAAALQPKESVAGREHNGLVGG